MRLRQRAEDGALDEVVVGEARAARGRPFPFARRGRGAGRQCRNRSRPTANQPADVHADRRTMLRTDLGQRPRTDSKRVRPNTRVTTTDPTARC